MVLAGQVIGVRLLPQQLWAGDYGLEVPWAEHEDIVQKLIPWQFLLSHMCKRDQTCIDCIDIQSKCIEVSQFLPQNPLSFCDPASEAVAGFQWFPRSKSKPFRKKQQPIPPTWNASGLLAEPHLLIDVFDHGLQTPLELPAGSRIYRFKQMWPKSSLTSSCFFMRISDLHHATEWPTTLHFLSERSTESSEMKLGRPKMSISTLLWEPSKPWRFMLQLCKHCRDTSKSVETPAGDYNSVASASLFGIPKVGVSSSSHAPHPQVSDSAGRPILLCKKIDALRCCLLLPGKLEVAVGFVSLAGNTWEARKVLRPRFAQDKMWV